MALWIVLWISSGAFIGGVVTPVLVADRQINDWTAMLLGLGAGAVGNVILLIPLWLGLSRMVPSAADHGPAWRRDAVTLDQLQTAGAAGGGPSLREMGQSVMPALRRNFWPAPRADEAHSHRRTYIGVFVALAVITAVEVLLSYLDTLDSVDFPMVWPLAALSSLKVLLVVAYFMHLRYDNRIYTIVFASSVPFALMVLIVLASVA